MTFAKDALPLVWGFWSLTMYNEHHFFESNNLVRYSLGTKNKDLQFGPTDRLRFTSLPRPHPGQDDRLAALAERRLLALRQSVLAGERSAGRQVDPPAVVKVK